MESATPTAESQDVSIAMVLVQQLTALSARPTMFRQTVIKPANPFALSPTVPIAATITFALHVKLDLFLPQTDKPVFHAPFLTVSLAFKAVFVEDVVLDTL